VARLSDLDGILEMYILFLRTEPPSTAIQWELEENRPGLRALVKNFLSDSSSICVKAVHKPTNKVRRETLEVALEFPASVYEDI